MKKLTLFLSAIVISLSSINISLATFSDVPMGHPNWNAINYVQEEGIVEGYPDGTYKPDITINRAEFTKIITEAVFTDQEINNCNTTAFKDIPINEWFAKYVCIAEKNNIIDGYPDGTFQPSNDIKIVEAAKIIVNGFGYETMPDQIWFKPYIDALADRNSLPQTLTGFEHRITRGEMAEIIDRLLSNSTPKGGYDYRFLEYLSSPITTKTWDEDTFSFSYSGSDIRNESGIWEKGNYKTHINSLIENNPFDKANWQIITRKSDLPLLEFIKKDLNLSGETYEQMASTSGVEYAQLNINGNDFIKFIIPNPDPEIKKFSPDATITSYYVKKGNLIIIFRTHSKVEGGYAEIATFPTLKFKDVDFDQITPTNKTLPLNEVNNCDNVKKVDFVIDDQNKLQYGSFRWSGKIVKVLENGQNQIRFRVAFETSPVYNFYKEMALKMNNTGPNRYENGMLYFALGSLEGDNFITSADIDEKTRIKILSSIDNHKQLTFDFAVKFVEGGGADNFGVSNACSIALVN